MSEHIATSDTDALLFAPDRAKGEAKSHDVQFKCITLNLFSIQCSRYCLEIDLEIWHA